jgi:hypothetical protein
MTEEKTIEQCAQCGEWQVQNPPSPVQPLNDRGWCALIGDCKRGDKPCGEEYPMGENRPSRIQATLKTHGPAYVKQPGGKIP